MMAASPLPLLLLVIVSSCVLSVLGQNSTGLNFTGPGYIACPLVDYQLNQCTFSVNENCTTAQVLVCNSTAIQDPTTDASFQIGYFPLLCECVRADGCAESCEYFNDDLPTLPPVTGFMNFTGIGNVTCPVADLFNTDIPCEPTVLDTASCGTCDTTILDETYGYTPGDESVTFPLTCECFVLIDCPNTCTFVATDSPVDAPVSAPTTVDAPVSAPTTVEAPVSVPTTVDAPVTAPVSVPSRPVSSPSAPVRSPVAAPTTSASFSTTSSSYECFAVMAVLTLMSSFLVL